MTTLAGWLGPFSRDRLLFAGAMLLVVAGSWAYLLTGAGTLADMGGMLMPMSSGPWTARHAAVMFAMWAVMMAAMMLPSAMPMILFFGRIASERRARGGEAVASMFFTLGYVAIWLAFSAFAVLLQLALERAALLSPMMETTSVVFAGLILAGAGAYQWTPFKQACLRRCRSPLEFVLTQWRQGRAGAFQMGARHGGYCLGCCWTLMLLLFVGGVMNLAWITGIALFVLVEKLAPAGHWLGRGAGLVLVAWGLFTLRSAFS
ncbi:MAG: DUF2182 domain-containing protein [Pseudomonadota bacterium]